MGSQLWKTVLSVCVWGGVVCQFAWAGGIDQDAQLLLGLRGALSSADGSLGKAEGQFADRNISWSALREGKTDLTSTAKDLDRAREALRTLKVNYGNSVEYQARASQFQNLLHKFYYEDARMQDLEIRFNNKGKPELPGDKGWYEASAADKAALEAMRQYADAHYKSSEFVAKEATPLTVKNPIVDRFSLRVATAEVTKAQQRFNGTIFEMGVVKNTESGAAFLKRGHQWLGHEFLKAAAEDLKAVVNHLSEADGELAELSRKGYGPNDREYQAVVQKRDLLVKDAARYRDSLARGAKQPIPDLESERVLAYAEEGNEMMLEQTKTAYASTGEHPDLGNVGAPELAEEDEAAGSVNDVEALKAEKRELEAELEKKDAELNETKCLLDEVSKEVAELKRLIEEIKGKS